MRWRSTLHDHGPVVLPEPIGIRVLMMPFLLADLLGTIPWGDWAVALRDMLIHSPWRGVGYLTIDEAHVTAGETHRRPGLHVDGWVKDSVWGGGGGGWGGRASGMLVAASRVGCEVFEQEFEGEPEHYGACDHLADQCQGAARRILEPNRLYHLGAMTVHRSLPAGESGVRQFVRVSGPSDAGWPVSCTPSLVGIQPTGPLLPARPAQFTNYR